MTTSTKAALASSTVLVSAKRAPLIVITGKGSVARMTAYDSIAVLSCVESKSRAELVATLDIALGKTPSDAQLNVAQVEYVAGRMSDRMAVGEFPRADMAGGDKIDFCRDLVMFKAAPVKDGTKAKKLQKHQTGRRTVTQEKALLAAKNAWQLLMAELGFSIAKTMAEKNAAAAAALKAKTEAATAAKLEAAKEPGTRAPQMAGASNKGGKPDPVPTVADLATVGEVTAALAIGHIALMASTLQQYANKHAKVLPTAYGMCVRRFAAAILQIEKDTQMGENMAENDAAKK